MSLTLTRISAGLTGRTRLTRIPCVKCCEDTIHDGLTCKTCGTCVPQGRSLDATNPWRRNKRKRK